VPRPPRNVYPGIHHIGAGASGPSNYYLDDVDHMSWIRLFVKTAMRHGWSCIVVCQMPTHWHAIVEVADHSLPSGMQYLQGEYSRTFNSRHSRVGYLVRDRYWSRRKDTERELLNAYAYVVNNPVRAGIVEAAEEWRWSSYATTLGLADAYVWVDASKVLAQFGLPLANARSRLRQYVAAVGAATPRL
jgi:REP-associated tyrosine transposase